MLERKWNDGWKFWKKSDSFALTPAAPEDAAVVTLPHDAMREEDARGDSPNGGNTGYRDGGVYTYEKALTVPADGAGSSWYVKFEGVYMNALVYLNGVPVANRPYGYSTFYVPLHDHLRWGEENLLRVEARNSAMTNSRWYSGSGIYRDVYLLSGGSAHIAPGGVRGETKAVTGDEAHVEVRVGLVNRGPAARNVTVRVRMVDSEGRTAAMLERPVPLLPGRERTFRGTMTVPGVKLWSAETPHLYTLETTLLEGETLVDESRDTFGVRTMTLDAQKGLRVNGETVKLRGACIHHDNGLLGAAEYEAAAFRRVRKLKEAGFNAIRMAHNPMSQVLLRACDALGMYVMDETFDMWSRCKNDTDYAIWFEDWWERDVEAMVAKDFNHPSVLLYCLGNEVPELGHPWGVDRLRTMTEKVKSLDPTRYTTAAVNGVFAVIDRMDQVLADVIGQMPEDKRPNFDEGGNVNSFMTVMDTCMDDIVRHPLVSEALAPISAAVDTVGYNYMTARYELDREGCPDRVIVGSESYPPEIGRIWDAVRVCPNVIGDFSWTGWDYIGEAGIGVPGYRFGEGGFGARFPVQLGYCGDLDITGCRRPASYYKEIVYGLRRDPYIAVQDPGHYGERMIKTNWVMGDLLSSWTWPGKEGAPIVAEVYAAAPEVELLLNGVSLGRRPAGPAHNYTARFELTYAPGTLTAVAWEGDRRAGETALVTAGTSQLRVIAEEERDGDLRFYAIELVDGHGVLDTAHDRVIRVQVKNGTLLGFGSGDPRTAYNYNGTETRTWQGRAQAIVLPAGEPEVIVTEG